MYAKSRKNIDGDTSELNVIIRKVEIKDISAGNIIKKAAHAFYGSLGFRNHGYSFIVDIDS